MLQRRPDMKGFTLIEAIIAIVVLASVIVSLQQGAAMGWRGVRHVEASRAAVDIARRRLANVGLSTRLTEKTFEEGEEGAFRWRVTVSNYAPPEGVRMPPNLRAYWVQVAVAWPDGPLRPPKSFELRTLKLQMVPN